MEGFHENGARQSTLLISAQRQDRVVEWDCLCARSRNERRTAKAKDFLLSSISSLLAREISRIFARFASGSIGSRVSKQGEGRSEEGVHNAATTTMKVDGNEFTRC